MNFNKIYLQNLYVENSDPECETGKLSFIWDRYPDNSFSMNLYTDVENVKDDERYIFLINVNFDPHGPFTSNADTREGVLYSLCELSDKEERFRKCIEDVKQKRALICFICYEPSNFYFKPYTELFLNFCILEI